MRHATMAMQLGLCHGEREGVRKGENKIRKVIIYDTMKEDIGLVIVV